MDERLNGTGIKKDKEGNDIVTCVEIPKDKPLILMKAFPHRTGKPLILSSLIMDAQIGDAYSIVDSEFEGKQLSKTKDKFVFNELESLKDAFSSVRFVKIQAWGKCFKVEKNVYVQKCKLIEMIKVHDIELAPSTASHLLMYRTDLDKEEIINCRNRIKLQEYGLYTHMFLSSKFDFDFYRAIKTEKVAICVTSAIISGRIKTNNIQKTIDLITEVQKETKEEAKTEQEWANLISLKNAFKKRIKIIAKEKEDKEKEKERILRGPVTIVKEKKEEGKNV